MANNHYYGDDREFIPIDKYLMPKEADKEEDKKEESLEEKIKPRPREINESEDKGFLKEILTDKISFLKQIIDEFESDISLSC